MKRRHHPEGITEALRARFPAPYSLTFEQIAEAVLEELTPPPEAKPADDGRLTPEQAKALLAEVELPQVYPGVPAGRKQLFEQRKCQHCVLPGAYVGGWMPKPIEEVVAGAAILGSSGHPERVEATVVHDHNGGIRTIGARGALPLRVTDEHPFLVFPRLHKKPNRSGWVWRQRSAPEDEKPVWKRADEVQVGDYLLCPIPHFDGPEAPERWSTPDAAWLLGLLAGDGWTHGRNGRLYYFGLVLSRQEDVDRACAVIESWGVKVQVKKSDRYWRVNACSREVAEDIAGHVGSGSSTKHLPSFVWSSEELLRAATEGLMAADGAWMDRGKRGKINRLFTTSRAMAWQMWLAQVALGEKPYIRAVNRRSGYENASPAWTVEWSDASKCYTARTEDYYVMPVMTIEAEPYSGPVYDLTVSDGTFVANGLLTHNCGGVHTRKCPAVKEISYHPDGKVARVVYFRHGEWDESSVLWLEDVIEAAEADGAE